MKRTVLDRVIGALSPAAELKRVKARAQMDLLIDAKRRYDGAAKTKRTEGWRTPSTGPNLTAVSALSTLRDRSRDLDRNNPYAKRANNLIAAYVAGSGIIPQAKARTDAQQKLIDQYWDAWGEATAIDVNGRRDFYGLQRAVMRNVALSGEAIVRRIFRSNAKDKLGDFEIPLKLQLLESDHIDSSKNEKTASGGRIIAGVEVDADGVSVAYWLYPSHPGDGDPGKSVRIPASEICHVFREDRIGQRRGIVWSAPVIIRLKDLDDYDDAQLTRQKIAACFAAIFHDIEPTEDGEAGDKIPEKLGPGYVFEAPPGKDVKFGTPPSVDGHADYTKAVLRGISVGYDLTYESLTSDLSNVNFSSGRMGRIDLKMVMKGYQDDILIPQFCQPVWRWFIEALQIKGVNTDGVTVTWTPPKWEYLDPVKEAMGTAIQIRNGEKTLAQAIRESGRDPRVHIEEISEMNKILDELGVILDSDARFNSGTLADVLVQSQGEDESAASKKKGDSQ